ncbi:recombinase family protein [Candidatus Synechococcus calcipolaris G9]|uniref:Recombinase family protein n=1 Tax=Candidatus Synechococcus calcipolaris G9 TaxID=1497997 RepID=A0ABT6F1B7_9SYNE|nr:recombinase family protein [Candidatus Synechococcus calcipolaris]MDG2991650.1 recombinase family protein [Candidatus Synechococcus calcipolaris G9]
MRPALWITGPTQSGKTNQLLIHLGEWLHQGQLPGQPKPQENRLLAQSILIFAANGDNRQRLQNQFQTQRGQGYRPYFTTPLGFLQDEVILFWPLIIKQAQLPGRFPLRLRPETEQELALQLWQPLFDQKKLTFLGENRDRAVRDLLDVMQLAGFAGIPLGALGQVLDHESVDLPAEATQGIMDALVQWRDWCLQRGLLTYGLMTHLYGQYLLPHPPYQDHLQQRFLGLVADDLDNYPALLGDVIQHLLKANVAALLTYNPNGGNRLGLGADPDALGFLESYCQGVPLNANPQTVLGEDVATQVEVLLTAPNPSLPAGIKVIQTISRMQLLEAIAQEIIQAVEAQLITAADIAIIGPGLDAIARYTLNQRLAEAGIATVALSDQRPLVSFPLVRALLAILSLIYPGCGDLLDREAIAEMLVVLAPQHLDPVRANLIADHCFAPHPDQPQLIPINDYSRWDRLSHQGERAYESLRIWIQDQRLSINTLPPVFILDQAIQRFLWPLNLASDDLAVLRELMETVQHYWQVQEHLQRHSSLPLETTETLRRFIHLIRRGTITADPSPQGPVAAVLLSTTFQYRSARLSHPWQFWLDVGGPLWQNGGLNTLWQAPLFLRNGLDSPSALLWQDETKRLQRLLVDLLSRAQGRVYWCHSDLGVDGKEQQGPLLGLLDLASIDVT